MAEELAAASKEPRLYQHRDDRHFTGGCLAVSLGCARRAEIHSAA